MAKTGEFTAGKGAAAAALTAFLAAAVWHFGRLHFSGYDLSSVINTAWLQSDGLIPYKDFFLPFPPAFALGAKAAFSAFGVAWPSLVAAACVFSAVTFNIHLYLLNRLLGWRAAAALALACQLLSAVLVSFWWYNSMTAAAACLFLTAALVFVSEPESRSANFWLAFSMALLLLMKPNAAGILLCAVTPVLLLKKERRARTLLALFLAAASCLSLLLFCGLSPAALFDTYALLSGTRGKPTLDVFYGGKMAEFFVSLPLLLACLTLVLMQLKEAARRSRLKELKKGELEGLLIALAGTAAGLISIFSSWELICVDLPPLFQAAFLAPLIRAGKKDGEGPYAVSPVFAVSLVSSLAAGFGISAYLLKNYYYSTPAAALAGIRLDSAWLLVSLLWLCLVLALVWSAARTLFPVPRRSPAPAGALPFPAFFAAAVLCVAALTLYAGAERWRVKISGPPYEDGPVVKVPGSHFFEGCRVSPWTAAVVRDIGAVLAGQLGGDAGKKKNGVFFGVRLEFAYAAFGFHAPRGFPVWWSARTSYREDSLAGLLAAFRERRFELCFFLRHRGLEAVDNGGGGLEVPREIMDYLRENYTLSYYGELAVFRIRPAKLPARRVYVSRSGRRPALSAGGPYAGAAWTGTARPRKA